MYVYYSFHFTVFCFHSGFFFCTLSSHLCTGRTPEKRYHIPPLQQQWCENSSFDDDDDYPKRWWRRKRERIFPFGTCDAFSHVTILLLTTTNSSDSIAILNEEQFFRLQPDSLQMPESSTLGWWHLKSSFGPWQNWCSSVGNGSIIALSAEQS